MSKRILVVEDQPDNRQIIRDIDTACGEVEDDGELSAGAIARRRSEMCDRALRKLVSFQPFEIAEKALTENIDALDRLTAPNGQQSQMNQNMTKAVADLREGLEATRRMVLDRCKMREGVSV